PATRTTAATGASVTPIVPVVAITAVVAVVAITAVVVIVVRWRAGARDQGDHAALGLQRARTGLGADHVALVDALVLLGGARPRLEAGVLQRLRGLVDAHVADVRHPRALAVDQLVVRVREPGGRQVEDLDGVAHVVVPDRRREASAVHEVVPLAVDGDVHHRLEALGEAVPHRRRELRRVPDEPGRGVVVGGTGLAGDRAVAEAGCVAGGARGRHDPAQRVGDGGRDLRLERLVALGVRDRQLVAVGI